MARSKYTLEIADLICDVIARAGTDEAGWMAAGISETTFYRWVEKYPEFAEMVLSAKRSFKATCPQALIDQANKALQDYLFGRMEKVQTVVETGMIDGKPFEKEKITRNPVGVPKWAIERVLGPTISEFDAIKVLVNAGYLPRDFAEFTAEQFAQFRTQIRDAFAGVLPQFDNAKQGGISPETGAAIRTHILYPEGFTEKQRVRAYAEQLNLL